MTKTQYSLFTLFVSLGMASSNAFAGAHADDRFLYTESNLATPDGNAVLAFHALVDGSLEPISGSPFLTGGAGFTDSTYALGPFDSDQEVITNPEHTLLFAVNGGSNSIAVFNIHTDGSLSAVKGSPFSSFGVQPASLGFERGTLIVVNKHQDPAQASDQSLPNYTTFQVANDGSLTHNEGSTIEVANGSSPSQALTYHGLVFGADFLGGLLQSFKLEGGFLAQNSPLALPPEEFQGVAAPRAPLGITISPVAPIAYIGYPTASKVGVYTFDWAGNLQFLRTAANSGIAVCWLRSNREGNRLYTTNSADHSVSVYDTTQPDQPVEIQKLVVNAQGGLFQLELDPANALIYVVEQRDAATVVAGQGNGIHVLSIDSSSGKIVELNDKQLKIDLPGDGRPQGLAIF